MHHQRLKKENNECQTDLQCTPFILNENETANVHSSRLCQTEIQLSPRAPDTELYKIIPYIDEDDIERNAIRLVNITRNRKIKLQFVLPIQKTDSPSPEEDNDYKYIITDGLDEEVTYVKQNENPQYFSDDSLPKTDNRRPQSEDIDSVSSIGTLKSAIKKILREDDSTQTDLMIAPHILNDHERAIITIHNSCQTSVTCSPRTSLTEVVPMLKSYWVHQGETREAFNKSENVLEILKEIIQDVINIHQHMFDPNYNLPNMNPVLVNLGPKNSSIDSSEWDTISPSKTTKKIMDISGDGSFENATLSELDASFKNKKFKDENDYKQSAIASISTVSEVTTLRSSDFTLTSTKDDDDDDDVEIDDDIDDISDILNHLKKKYTSPNDEGSENVSNVKITNSEPIITSNTEPKTVTQIKSNLNCSKYQSNVELVCSELCSKHKEEETDDDDVNDETHKCQMINSNCVCSGIKIKLYLKDKFDSNNGSSERFIEMKIKPDLETVEIKKLLHISTDPELTEICSTIPFQEIENCFKHGTDDYDSTEDLAKLFGSEDHEESMDVDIGKSEGFEIKVNIAKKSALSPQTTSEQFLQSFLTTNFLLNDVENTPYPEMLDKVPFPIKTCGQTNQDNDDAEQMELCSCKRKIEEKSEMPKYQKPVAETLSPFTAVFSRLYEDPDKLIPFDTTELLCGCKHGENDTVTCNIENETFTKDNDMEKIRSADNLATEVFIETSDCDFEPRKRRVSLVAPIITEENRELQSMSSYAIFPVRPAKSADYYDIPIETKHKKSGIISTYNQKINSSITYDGHIYETDNFFLSGSSDGSDDSIRSSIIDELGINKFRKQPYTISYEEHMYKTDGEIIPHESDTSLSDMDCICAMKLEKTLRECPHCFRRIGPQYGRDQRGLNDEYDQHNEMKEHTDCSTKQNATGENKRESHLNPIYSNYRTFSSNDKPIYAKEKIELNTSKTNNITEDNSESDTTKNVDSSNNFIQESNITEEYTSENDNINNMDAFNNLIESIYIPDKNTEINNIAGDFDTPERNIKGTVDAVKDSRGNVDSTDKVDSSKYVEFTEKIYPTGKILIGKLNTHHPDALQKDTEPKSKCSICYRDKPCPKILCNVTDIVKDPLNYECSKSAVEQSTFGKGFAESATSKTKCKTCPKEKLYENLVMEPLQATSTFDKVIADVEEKYKATSKTKCQTCSKAKLSQTSKKPVTMEQDTPSLDNIIADMEEKYKATSKVKCQTCSKAKLNKTSNKNLTMVTTEGICCIYSSKDKLVDLMKYDAKFNKSCTAICNRGSRKSKINVEEKRSIENLQKLTQMEGNVRTQLNKTQETVTKKCLSCSNLVNKDSYISSIINHQEKSFKSLTTQKNKCSACKKSLKFGNTTPKSKSLNCTCVNSKCRHTQNMDETVCLMKQKSTENLCAASKVKPTQYICSEILFHQVRNKLNNLPGVVERKISNVECPRPPNNSLESNCKCSKCIFAQQLSEVNKSTHHCSKCINLPYNSVQKIFEKNLSCSCSSSSTNQKEENSVLNLDYLSEKKNSCYAKCSQNKDTPKSTRKIASDKIQEKRMLSEQIKSTSGITLENRTRQVEKEKMFNEEIEDADLLSTYSIITQPRVRILNAPIYIYQSYNSFSNDELSTNSKDSLDNFKNESKNIVRNIKPSTEEYLLVKKNVDLQESRIQSTKPIKTMNIHKLDGKHSVFSIEKKHETGGSQTTVYILPNTIFGSLVSIPPPHFLLERSKSEIDDITQFSYLRNLHYEKNPKFDKKTVNSNHNSEEFMNIIANQNLPNLNCAITCSCSLSVPKNQQQQTDKINNIKVDKTTSITGLKKSKCETFISEQSNSVGRRNSYILFHTRPHSEKTSFSSILKPAFKKQKLVDNDNVKSLENSSHDLEANPIQIMGKYITWEDLIRPNLYNSIPIQNAITSVEPFIEYSNQKLDRSVQTSNISFITLMEPSIATPLTIEASTSTENLEMETSIINSSRYYISEHLSTIDLPLQYATTSDSNISTDNKIMRRHIFQTPSATKLLKKTFSPLLTLEASTSTTSRNQATIQTEDFTSKLSNNSLHLSNTGPSDKSLNEGEATSKSEVNENKSALNLPTNKISTSTPLTKVNSPYKHTTLEAKSSIPEATTSKVQTDIDLTNIISPLPSINTTTLETFSEKLVKLQEISTSNMSPSISLPKITLSSMSELEEPNDSKLAHLESFSQIPLTGDQISHVSLPKVESCYSILESNYDPIDANINFNKFYLNEQERSYPQEDFKQDDVSVLKKDASIHDEPLLDSESAIENNEQFEDKTNSETPFHHSIISEDSKEVIDDKTPYTKLLSDITTPKWNISSKSENYSESSKISSNINDIFSASPTSNEENHNKLNLSTIDEYDNLGLNKELKDSSLDTTSIFKDSQKNVEYVPEEPIYNIQLENLLSTAIDAYSAYLSLKKGIPSNLNVSNIDLPSQNAGTHNYPKYNTEENEKDGSREFSADDVSTKTDYHSAYLQRKNRISSLISIAKMDSSNSYSEYRRKRDKNSLKLSVTNVDFNNTYNSRDDFLSKTEKAYSKILKRNENSPKISVSNIYSSFENIPKHLQTDTKLNEISSNFRYSVDSGPSTSKNFKQDTFTSEGKEEYAEFSPLSSVLTKDSSYQNTTSKQNVHRDFESNKFIFKTDDDNSISSKGKDLHNSTDKKIKIEKDINKIESEYSEIHKRNPKDYRNSNKSLYSFNNEDSYLRKTKMEPLNDSDSLALEVSNNTINLRKEDDHAITNKHEDKTSSMKVNSPYHYSNSAGPNTSKDLKSDKFIFKTKDTKKEVMIASKRSSAKIASSYLHSILEHESSGVLKSNDYSTHSKEQETISPSPSPYPYSLLGYESSRDLKLNDYSTYTKRGETISPSYLPSISENKNSRDLKSNDYFSYLKKEGTISPRSSTSKIASPYTYSILEPTSSRDIKSNDYSTYTKTEEIISPERSSYRSAPSYIPSISENTISKDFKSNDYFSYHKKEETISPGSSTSKIAPPYTYSIVEEKRSRNIKPYDYSTYTKKEEIISPDIFSYRTAASYLPSTSENKSSRDLKSNDYLTYPKKEKNISPGSSTLNTVPPYSYSMLEHRSSRDIKSNDYSTYLKKEETVSPRRSTSKIASPYSQSISESRNPKDLKSNKFVYYPESRDTISSSRNFININLANNKNSATSKLSSFVRNGATSAILSNIGDSPQQLSAEEIDRILPEIAVSSHRVLEAVQSCEQRLQPIKSALKDIKMKLKELNMPEVNGILQNDHLVDENKTYIYLPPPPPPLASSRCSYRTKMTFQLKKPIKPLSVTANVNPYSIKHKYILNDADMNRSILNANYSSVSDPPYYVQRKSMNSIHPNFNQPLHSQRYHPDTYYERSHTTRTPVEVIEEDLPFSPEDLEGHNAMDQFQQYQYLPNHYDTYYYQPRTESLNNYVMFPPIMENSRVYVPVANNLSKTNEQVFHNHNMQNNMKMFPGDHPVWRKKAKK